MNEFKSELAQAEINNYVSTSETHEIRLDHLIWEMVLRMENNPSLLKAVHCHIVTHERTEGSCNNLVFIVTNLVADFPD